MESFVPSKRSRRFPPVCGFDPGITGAGTGGVVGGGVVFFGILSSILLSRPPRKELTPNIERASIDAKLFTLSVTHFITPPQKSGPPGLNLPFFPNRSFSLLVKLRARENNPFNFNRRPNILPPITIASNVFQ